MFRTAKPSAKAGTNNDLMQVLNKIYCLFQLTT